MNKKQALEALKILRKNAKKRNFSQTVEFVVNFTGLDVKKPENQINLKLSLPNSTGKGSGKIAVFTKTDEFRDSVKDKADLVIDEKEIESFAKSKQKVSDLIEYDALFAEGAVMLTVAKFLGQQLAPKGKMPKSIQNVASFDETLAKARTQVTVSNKKGKPMPVIHTVVGKEDMEDEKIAENMAFIYENVREALPQKKQNIKSIYVKLTMSTPIKIGGDEQ